jgi:hypothetical protein
MARSGMSFLSGIALKRLTISAVMPTPGLILGSRSWAAMGSRVWKPLISFAPKASFELVDLAVARAVADVRAQAEPLLRGLPHEERDVGVVARVEQHVGPHRAELGHQRGEIGRADE